MMSGCGEVGPKIFPCDDRKEEAFVADVGLDADVCGEIVCVMQKLAERKE